MCIFSIDSIYFLWLIDPQNTKKYNAKQFAGIRWGQNKKRLATIACLLESVLIYDFSARVCNFITANRYLRIGETLIPRRRFPFRNPAFVLFCTCVNSRCNRSFLFPLVFTLCYSCLPVARCRVCASLPYASPGSYSVVPRLGIIPSWKVAWRPACRFPWPCRR